MTINMRKRAREEGTRTRLRDSEAFILSNLSLEHVAQILKHVTDVV